MAIIKEKKFRISSVIESLSPTGLVEGETERTEITPDGFLKISDGEIVIMYSEQTESGKVISDIIITEKSVSVKRRGAVVSDMVFVEGESHKSLYEVSSYSFDTEIYTKKIRNNMTRDGGRLDIFYSMKIGGVDRAVKMKIETL
jgi:uncharacterized beta-barrel protein YwiB (DUF1934 family)